MISQIIEQWKSDTENIYKNKDLIKFIKPLLEYVYKKDVETKENIYDFISSRMNFTTDFSSELIMKYMKKTFNEKNEIKLKKKFKLVKELGSDRREKLVENLKHHIKKINEIENREKQLVTQKQSLEECQETIKKRDLEISRLKKTIETISMKSNFNEKIIKESNEKVNKLTDENYKLLHEQNEEMKYSREKDRIISQKDRTILEKDRTILEKDKIISQKEVKIKDLNKQLNHLKEQ